MKLTKIASVHPRCQDGAFWNGLCFRFDCGAHGFVYNIEELCSANGAEVAPMARFMLSGIEKIRPHSNSVVFGAEYFADGDEFPLLYSNVYNNYEFEEEQRKGMCLVYRLQRDGDTFSATPVQAVQVGFSHDDCWTAENEERPFGNFVIDTKTRRLYAFVMRIDHTRCFVFSLPGVTEGEMDESLGVKKVLLTKDDVIDWFDYEYQEFMQGACFHDGKIYTTEGYSIRSDHEPTIRVIDVVAKKQVLLERFAKYGAIEEPELIDFVDGVCYYSDAKGDVYTICF